MSGVMRSFVAARPTTRPDNTPTAATRRIATRRPLWWVDGYWLITTVDSPITPTTEKSMPRCWITNIWPIDAIAKMLANGSIDSSEAPDRPPGIAALTTKRRAVANQMTENSLNDL